MNAALIAATQRRRQPQNLVVASEGPVSALNAVSGAPQPTNQAGTDGFTRWIAFPGPTASTQYAYTTPRSLLVIGARYNIAFFVRMDDGGAPILAGPVYSSTDMALVFNGDVLETGIAPRHLGGGLYRIVGTEVARKTGGNVGIVKFSGQSPRGFRVTGYQLSTGGHLRPYLPREP